MKFSSLKYFCWWPFRQKLYMRNILCNVCWPIPILVDKVWRWKLDYAKIYKQNILPANISQSTVCNLYPRYAPMRAGRNHIKVCMGGCLGQYKYVSSYCTYGCYMYMYWLVLQICHWMESRFSLAQSSSCLLSQPFLNHLTFCPRLEHWQLKYKRWL